MNISPAPRQTASMSPIRFARTAQAIQRKYFDKVSELLATATDEQVEQFKTAIGAADTLGVFAAEQEQARRSEGFLAAPAVKDEPASASEAYDEAHGL